MAFDRLAHGIDLGKVMNRSPISAVTSNNSITSIALTTRLVARRRMRFTFRVRRKTSSHASNHVSNGHVVRRVVALEVVDQLTQSLFLQEVRMCRCLSRFNLLMLPNEVISTHPVVLPTLGWHNPFPRQHTKDVQGKMRLGFLLSCL